MIGCTRLCADFFVEHMSSTLNVAESEDAFPLLLNRTLMKCERLKNVALMKHSKLHYFKDVVAVIPFAMRSGLSASADNSITQRLRLSFFESTFWSIYRYFPSVVVSVSRQVDYEGLMSLNLPLFHVFTSFRKGKNQPVYYNVKEALLNTHEMLTTNITWVDSFRYVYFSEGDSILHMRSQKLLHELMAAPNLDGEVVLVPHRMQTMPIPQNLPPKSGIIPEWKRKAYDITFQFLFLFLFESYIFELSD